MLPHELSRLPAKRRWGQIRDFNLLEIWLRQRRSLLRPQFKTIAVLSLQNYSGEPQQEYFVDGMTDSVIADLGKIKDLRVSHVIDPDVYELYLKGRHIMERGGLQDVRN